MNYPDEDILEERAINKVEIGEFEKAAADLRNEEAKELYEDNK